VPTESFFNFFSPPQPPTDDDDSVASDIEERLELDYQLGEDIKEKLIPRAIDWFTGEALQFEELGEDIDPEEFDDEDDEDEDDEDDEDERGSASAEDDSDDEVRCVEQDTPFSKPDANYCFFRMALPSPRRRRPSASKTRNDRKEKQPHGDAECFMDL